MKIKNEIEYNEIKNFLEKQRGFFDYYKELLLESDNLAHKKFDFIKLKELKEELSDFISPKSKKTKTKLSKKEQYMSISLVESDDGEVESKSYRSDLVKEIKLAKKAYENVNYYAPEAPNLKKVLDLAKKDLENFDKEVKIKENEIKKIEEEIVTFKGEYQKEELSTKIRNFQKEMNDLVNFGDKKYYVGSIDDGYTGYGSIDWIKNMNIRIEKLKSRLNIQIYDYEKRR